LLGSLPWVLSLQVFSWCAGRWTIVDHHLYVRPTRNGFTVGFAVGALVEGPWLVGGVVIPGTGAGVGAVTGASVGATTGGPLLQAPPGQDLERR
jgi:hypothetical protein